MLIILAFAERTTKEPFCTIKGWMKLELKESYFLVTDSAAAVLENLALVIILTLLAT